MLGSSAVAWAQSDVYYIDKTNAVNTAWTNCVTNQTAGYTGTDFAPAVTTADGRNSKMAESYETNIETTGNILKQEISNLENGTYKVVLYANAFFTSGRGFGDNNNMENGAEDVAYVFANNKKAYIKAIIGTSTTQNGEYTISDVTVTDGKLTLGLGKDKAGTNWHSIQIKSLALGVENTQSYWQEAQTEANNILKDPLYTNVGGSEKKALENAIKKTPSTNADYYSVWQELKSATANFIAAKDAYDALVKENTKAQRFGLDGYTITDETTAAIAIEKVKEIKVQVFNKVKTDYPTAIQLGEWTNSGNTAFNKSQHWSDNGETGYWEQKNDPNNKLGWDGQNWNIWFEQNIILPKGNYVFKMTGRHGGDDPVTSTMALIVKDGETTIGTVNDFPVGDAGLGVNKNGETSFDATDAAGFANNNNGRGWEWRYVPFTLEEEKNVTIRIEASATSTHQWCSFCDYSVVATADNIGAIKTSYEQKKAEAETALASEDYAAVTGSERTALTTAKDKAPASETKEGYETAINAIDEALTTFKEAKPSYDKVVAANTLGKEYTAEIYPYATAEKINDLTALLSNTEYNDAAAAEKAAGDITTAYRAVVMSNSIAENVEGREDYTTAITNPKGNTTGWTQSGGGKNIRMNSGQAPTMNGETISEYFDSNNWNDNNWDKELTQEVTVPAGKYLLAVTARGSKALTYYNLLATAGGNEAKTAITKVDGDPNATFGQGWNDNTIEFESTGGSVKIGIQAKAQNAKNSFVSFTNFRLTKIGELSDMSYTREVTADYGTICLPYAAAATSGIDKVYTVKTADADVVTIEPVEGNKMEAGVPYIFKKESTATEIKVTYTGKAVATPVANDYLVGTFHDNGNVETGAYVLSGDKFYLVDSDIPFTANRAYLKLTTSEAKAMRIIIADPTGITSVNNDAAETDTIYNLNGQRIAAPAKGLYIKNGKKVIIK